MSRRGFVVECKRKRQKNTRTRFRAGTLVRLRDGTTVRVVRAVVHDWSVEYEMSNGTSIMQHHIMGRVSEK